LDKFDYLSTVSGGGFIGGGSRPGFVARAWTTSWRSFESREGHRLCLIEAVEHMRVYSNYLSPQPGLLSADTWT